MYFIGFNVVFLGEVRAIIATLKVVFLSNWGFFGAFWVFSRQRGTILVIVKSAQEKILQRSPAEHCL